MYHFECNADSKKEMISRLMKQIFMIEPDFIKKSFADYDEAQTAKGGQAEVRVKQVACGHCKDCKFWNDKSAECTNDVIWLNSDMQTKKTKRSKTFYNISDLKTNLNFGCIRFESKPSV